MNQSADGLDLAHTLANADFLVLQAEKSVFIFMQRAKYDRNRGCPPHSLQKSLIVFDLPGERGRQLGQSFTLGLGDIEHFNRFEIRNRNHFLFRNRFAISVQQQNTSVRVALFTLYCLLGSHGSDDLNTVLAAFHISTEAVLPLVVTGDQCGVRLLQVNQHGVIEGIAVKAAHGLQIGFILVRGEQLLNACLDLTRDLL